MQSNSQSLLSRVARLWFLSALFLLPRMGFAQTGGVPQAQYDALVAFYNSTGGTNWFIQDNWLSSEPVENWFGVLVSNGNVVGLNLSFNNLTGSIPAQTANLPLTDLFVSGNALTGISKLPATLLNLDCSSNQVSALPALSAGLQTLNGAANALSSLPAFPATLTGVDVSFNKLTLLPPLPAGLTSLNCSTNRIVLLPPLPAALVTLNCSNNRQIVLPKLPAGLNTLIANNNCLVVLPALPASLTLINVSFNQLFSLPALPANTSLNILAANNRLTFEDLELIVGRFRAVGQYAPQLEVGFAYTLNVPAGTNLSLNANFAGNTPSTRYVWLKDSVRVSDTLSVPVLKINNVQAVNAGKYTARISSKLVPGLVLVLKPITVKVTGSSAAAKTSLVMYPNPTVRTVQLTKPEGESWGDRLSVSIVSEVNGALVLKSEAYSFGKTLDIAHLNAGRYVVQVSDGKQSQSLHLVKE
jgi:Secretion system C-terminal sorting domain